MDAVRSNLILYVLVGNAVATPAFAHSTGINPPVSSWGFWILAGLLITLAAYLAGLRLLWRGAHRAAAVRPWNAACFLAGWAALGIALLSPLDTLGSKLFSIHMLQHELLMVVAAPLIVLGRPHIAFFLAVPPRWRKRVARIVKSDMVQRSWARISQPFSAWLIHAIVLWAWHIPALFESGLADDAMHALQHFSFLASALLFWSSLIAPGLRLQMRYGASVLYLLMTCIHTGMLGALLTFSPRSWYPSYSATTGAWGLTALEDQQLGGLIMWVPAGVVFVFAGLAMAATAMHPEWHTNRRAR